MADTELFVWEQKDGHNYSSRLQLGEPLSDDDELNVNDYSQFILNSIVLVIYR